MPQPTFPTVDGLTELVLHSFDGLTSARTRELIQALVRHLHDYARETRLQPAEWAAAVQFLHRVGEISDTERSEFMLLSDVLGLSSLVDLQSTPAGSSAGSLLGPFHASDSPWHPNPANLIGSNDGEPVLLRGRVTDAQGRPLAGAVVDFWQNAANGKYWQTDPAQPRDNLRCRLHTDADGAFEIATIRCVPYTIPTDGPVYAELVAPAGRSEWRPAHYHLIVEAPGHQRLTTELFLAGDPYLQSDAVFGVRESLVLRPETVTDPDACLRHAISGSKVDWLRFELRLVAACDDVA